MSDGATEMLYEEAHLAPVHAGTRAHEVLLHAADAIEARAEARGMAAGTERSMAHTVAMFNAYRAGEAPISELDGWMFMAFLKIARSAAGTFHEDDFIDGAAYLALAAECADPINEYP